MEGNSNTGHPEKKPEISTPRIIIALDVSSEDQALTLAEKLDPKRCRVKIGMKLFNAAGPVILEKLHKLGFDIFLDLKWYDIPTVVASACQTAAEHGVWMMNVHASGGRRMMEAARNAVQHFSPRPLLIAVTVPTSMGTEDLTETGIPVKPAEQVRTLAQLAQKCGLDGIVCSAADLKHIHDYIDHACIKVTPGIRITNDSDDQRRVMTPGDAVRSGADYLVIGRPITQAPDPIAALEAVEHDIRHAES